MSLSASTSGVSTPQQILPTSEVANNIGTVDSVSGEVASSSSSANTRKDATTARNKGVVHYFAIVS